MKNVFQPLMLILALLAGTVLADHSLPLPPPLQEALSTMSREALYDVTVREGDQP